MSANKISVTLQIESSQTDITRGHGVFFLLTLTANSRISRYLVVLSCGLRSMP